MVSVRYLRARGKAVYVCVTVKQGYPRRLASSIVSTCGSHRGCGFVHRTGMPMHNVSKRSVWYSWQRQPICAAAKERYSTVALLPAAPALAEVAAAVASFASCRLDMSRQVCLALPTPSARRASRPALCCWLDEFFGRAPRWTCSPLGGYRTGLQSSSESRLQGQVYTPAGSLPGACAEHIAESAAVLRVLGESVSSSRRELEHASLFSYGVPRVPRVPCAASSGRKELDLFQEIRIHRGATSAPLDPKR